MRRSWAAVVLGAAAALGVAFAGRRRAAGRVRSPAVAPSDALPPPDHGDRAGLAVREGLEPNGLDGVLLHVVEIEAVIAAIRARPDCALLVFGVGNDSALWTRVNAQGTTLFLENDAEWARRVAASLPAAQIAAVSYRTTRGQWRALLDDPGSLAMSLPRTVRERPWDVVLVDGPAGYDDTTPGRMQSIYEASRLVAPGGIVFVHDCERPVEQAYCERYLGADRLAVSVAGHALLNGYAC